MRSRIATAACAVALLTLGGCRRQGAYPDAPLLILCPWAVGGGTDRVSRQLAAFLEVELGVPVNVINATGGDGVTGHSRGAQARPDGYTLTMMTVEINMLRWRKLTEISWEDFTPLMLINRDAAAIFVRDEAPWRDLHDLEAAIRVRPGQLTASGTATGGIWHLAVAGWVRTIGLEPSAVKWVPAGGAGPSLKELASGGIDFAACSLPEARPQIESGTIRCLGVMADERVPRYPDVPTFREQGTAWAIGGWRGLALPRGAPPAVVDRLLVALRRIVTGETVIGDRRFPDFMAQEGFDASWEVPPEFLETLDRTDRELGRFLASPEFATLSRAPVGPYAFPQVAAGGIVLCALVLALRRRRRGEVNSPSGGAVIHFLEVVAGVVLFVLFVESIGFLLAAGALLFLLLVRLGTRAVPALLITATLVPLIYELFAHVLRVPLPRGLIGW